MELWMSEEIMADVGRAYMVTRKAIKEAVNEQLRNCPLSTSFKEWAFIAIVLDEDGPDYPEIAKKHVKRKVLEFRLKINHDEFLSASESGRAKLIFDALKRSISLMSELGVSAEDREKLSKALDAANKKLKTS